MSLSDAEIKELKRKHNALYSDYMENGKLDEIDVLLKENASLLKEADEDYYPAVRILEKEIMFMLSETADDEMGKDMTEFAQEECAFRNAQIEEIVAKRDSHTNGLWRQRRKLKQDRQDEVKRLIKARDEATAISFELRKYEKPKPAPKPSNETSSDIDFDVKTFDELAEMMGMDPDPESPENQIHDLMMDLDIAQTEAQWNKISYERLERKFEEITSSRDSAEKQLDKTKKLLAATTARKEALSTFVKASSGDYEQKPSNDVERHLDNYDNWRYTKAVFKLNGMPNIAGSVQTALFKEYKYDGRNRNGHSKAMLALRFGVATDYQTTKSLQFRVHQRRKNTGNDVDVEFPYKDEMVQAIISLEVDSRDRFVVGTFKTFYSKNWEKAEQALLPRDYKQAHRPIEWYIEQHYKVKEYAERLIAGENEKKASG